ncbi:MAG: PHP domain-containing protein, partial [Prevotella sp.]
MKEIKNYTVFHLHTDFSLLDSCTDFKDYVDRAVELGQTAIAFSEHGKPLNWVSKKLYCDENGIKYLHAVECYLTETLDTKVRDNYHTVLIAKNYEGLLEINKAISLSCQPDHFYYVNRMTFDEFLKLSDNVIKTSACLASPLNKLPITHPLYEELV